MGYIFKNKLSFVVVSFMLLLSYVAHAIETDGGEGMNYREKKYVTLTLGISHDEKIIDPPPGVKFKGDYKRVTDISRADENGNIILRFEPKKEGIGVLLILDKKDRVIAEYRLDVKKTKLDAIANEIQNLLGDIEGISIRIVNNKVMVDGQILLPRDMNRIHSVIRQYGPDIASSLVTLSPLAQKKICELIERDINNPEIHVRSINDKFILEGVAGSDEEKKRATDIANMYVPDTIVEAAEADGVVRKRKVDAVVNMLTVKQQPAAPPGKMIQVVVHYVELSKDYTNGFRFQWTPSLEDKSNFSFGSGRDNASVTSTITGVISNLLPKLNWAKEHGHARILQSASLIVEDGKKGNLNSVSNVPYQTVSKDGMANTSFAECGIKTTVTPRILGARSDSLSMELDFGLSSLIGMTSAGPMTSASSINTVVTVRSGQSAAVGGLISSSSSTDYNKLPKSSAANPILSLYASKDFQRKQSQFVVFVTPIIKSSASSGAEKIKQKFRLRD